VTIRPSSRSALEAAMCMARCPPPGMTDDPGTLETEAVQDFDRVVHVSLDVERRTHRSRRLAALLIAERLEDVLKLVSERLGVFA
jgi:hypothetical protein